MNIAGKEELRLMATISVRNTGETNLWLGADIKLRHIRGRFFNDDVVVFNTGKTNGGIVEDEIGGQFGDRASFAQAGPFSVPPGQSDWPFTLFIPGPRRSTVAFDWWASHDDSNYDLEYRFFELPSQGSRTDQGGREIGRHDYDGFLNIRHF